MINHHTNELFFDNVEVPAGKFDRHEEGMGFRYIIDGWNAERILVAAEAIGDGRWFVERARRNTPASATSSADPSAPIKAIQFPIAQSLRAISRRRISVRYQAATKFDRKEKCGAEANLAKYLASEAAWEARQRVS